MPAKIFLWFSQFFIDEQVLMIYLELGAFSSFRCHVMWAMATDAWFDIFPNSSLKNLDIASSDHSPILLATEMRTYVYRKRQFRFENSWLIEPELEPVVKDSWARNEEDPILLKLLRCTEDLNTWGRRLVQE